MPLLAALLGNAFTALVAYLGTIVGRKLAVGAAYTAFLVAGVVGLQVAIRGAWDAVAFVMPASMVRPLGVVAYLLPSNFGACVTAISTAVIARWLWDQQKAWAQSLAAA